MTTINLLKDYIKNRMGRHPTTIPTEGRSRSTAAPPGAQPRASASEHEQKPGVASTAPPGSEAGGYQNSLPAPRSGHCYLT
jgi:hypothetical protein